MNILIRGGRVIDPANRVDAHLNILTREGKIAYVGTDTPPADKIIDATGKTVTPGFIDIHMHEDPVENGAIQFDIFNAMLRMGVTTAVGGNCGINVYDPAAYLDLADKGAPVNVAMLAGHEYFRKAAGAEDIYAGSTEAQQAEMAKSITKALDAGCVGVSFGLRYVPGADKQEFYRAAQCCENSKKIIASHVRNDADGVFDAIDEFCQAGWEYGLPVQISHIGSMGGFGQMEQVLRRLDAMRLNGLDVMLDCYPYFAFSTRLGTPTYDPGWLDRYHCGYEVLEFCEGKYKGQRATKETFDEMRRKFPECVTVCHVMQEQDVRLAFRHPAVMVGSDGLLSHSQGHPRAAGSFPRFLKEFAREGELSLYDAVAKITAIPADRLGLTHKGRLNVGADADITVFDFESIRDKATFAQPVLPPEGIEWVLIDGKIAAQNSQITDGTCGRSVRK